MNRNNRFPVLAFCVALAVAAVQQGASAADGASDVLGPAIEMAQKRTVKIFGAGIARDPGYATGLLVSDDGLILTAQGISLSGERIRIALADGSIHQAKIVRRSQNLQAVLLKIDGVPTPDFYTLSGKMPARKGDWVLAVSNAFKVADGPEPLSVNLGVVSLRTRLDAQNGVQDVPYEGDLVLIDAITSNPGAPGGAVVTVDGQLVGMVGRIMESKATSTRLNYAVPVDLLKAFVENTEAPPMPAAVVKTTTTGKSETGIRLFTLSTKRDPAFIDRVIPGSPAAAAGLKVDDLVMSIAGQVIHDSGEFKTAITALPPDEEVEIVVKRKNDVVTVKIKPAKAP